MEVATSSAADDERPAPRGTVPVISSAGAGGANSRGGELGDDAMDERPPPGGRARGSVGLEPVGLGEVQRVRLDAPVARRRRAYGDPLGDGERQGQAVVVVGELADQVEAPGSERGHMRGRAFAAAAGIDHAAAAIAARSANADSSGSTSPMKVPAPCSDPAAYLSLSRVRSGG